MLTLSVNLPAESEKKNHKPFNTFLYSTSLPLVFSANKITRVLVRTDATRLWGKTQTNRFHILHFSHYLHMDTCLSSLFYCCDLDWSVITDHITIILIIIITKYCLQDGEEEVHIHVFERLCITSQRTLCTINQSGTETQQACISLHPQEIHPSTWQCRVSFFFLCVCLLWVEKDGASTQVSQAWKVMLIDQHDVQPRKFHPRQWTCHFSPHAVLNWPFIVFWPFSLFHYSLVLKVNSHVRGVFTFAHLFKDLLVESVQTETAFLMANPVFPLKKKLSVFNYFQNVK